MNLTSTSSSSSICDLVVEADTREASLNLHATAAGHPDSVGFADVACDPPVFEDTRWKPRLNDDYATWRQVLAKTGQRSIGTIEGSQIPDRAEQTRDSVVPVREPELAHVGFEKPTGRVFLPGDAHKGGVEI
jgi:hypothetical protein